MILENVEVVEKKLKIYKGDMKEIWDHEDNERLTYLNSIKT